MISYELLPSKKNELFEAINESRFEPLDFLLTSATAPHQHGRYGDVVDSATISVMCYVPNREYSFAFDTRPNRSVAIFSPGSNNRHEVAKFDDPNHMLAVFRDWLDTLHQEVSSPDPWAEIRAMHALGIGQSGKAETGMYGRDETKQIAKALDGFSEKLNTSAVSNHEELRALRQDVEDLKATVNKLTKSQWNNMALGILMKLYFQYPSLREDAKYLYDLIRDIVDPAILS